MAITEHKASYSIQNNGSVIHRAVKKEKKQWLKENRRTILNTGKGLKCWEVGGERGLGSERTCGGSNKLQDRGYESLEVESNPFELRRFGLWERIKLIGWEEDFPLLGSSASVTDGLENVVPSNGGFSSNSSISVSAAAREGAAADKGCHGYAEQKLPQSQSETLVKAATEHKLLIRVNDRSSSWFGVSFIVLSLPFSVLGIGFNES